MLDLLIKSPVRRKILGLFSLNPEAQLFAGEVALEIGGHPYAVGIELNSLAKGGVLKKLERGRQVFYRWNESYPYAPELKAITERMRDAGVPEFREISDLKRREEIQRNLQQVLEGLKKYYDPEKVILFGSAASGKVGPYSDIDLIVIKKTSLPYFDRVEQVVNLLDYDIDIDFLVYTPEEFEKAVRERRFFQEEIIKRGKVIYEKAA